jgi:hypothetical protein
MPVQAPMPVRSGAFGFGDGEESELDYSEYTRAVYTGLHICGCTNITNDVAQ